MKKRPSPTPVALACAAALLAGVAHAQDSAPVNNLGVVEVTGQSRVQQLQDVPITMSVVGADKVKSLGAVNIGQLDGYVPGLSVSATQPTQPSYSMRGIGTGDFGIGTDAPVGVYLNGVYTGKTGGALLNFNDVKRIEVLRGPQGTLFGRNAAGGAISIVNNDPANRQEASGTLRLGDRGTRHIEALYNNAINDSTAFRISAVGHHQDGWLTNSFDGKKMGGADDWGTRMALRWAGEETSVLLSWEHEKLDQPARPVFLLPAQPSFPVDPSNWQDPRGKTLANDPQPNSEARKFDGVTLKIEHTTPIGELTSLTAWRHFDAHNFQDNDGTALRAHYLMTGNVEQNTTWQQEFRLNGKTDKLNWVAGVSAYYEKAKQTSQVNAYTDSLDTLLLHNPAAGLAPYATVTGITQMLGIPGVNLLGQTWQENMNAQGVYKAVAAYGDVIWKLGDATNLTGGIRFTRDEKEFSWLSPNRIAPGLDAQLAALDKAGFFPGLVAMGAMSPEEAGALQYLMTSNLEFNDPRSASTPLKTKTSWNDVSPRLVLDHHLDKNTMLFGSVTRGYQAGGFNALSVGGQYEPERVTNYEIGAKGRVEGTGLFYTSSLFHYDFTNLQSLTLVPASTPAGVPSYQVTVSDQTAIGLDLEAQWQIDKTWRINGAAEYIDQTYKHFSTPGGGKNLAGQPVGTPKWTATLGGEAVVPLAQGRARFNLNWAYSGAQRCNDDSQAQGGCIKTATLDIGEARLRVDARIGWEAPQQRWGVALLINNLTDKQYVSAASTTGAPFGAPYASVTPPRQISIEISAKL
ncbi:TonB-dependent receptor [Roseateles violae]|uniref:TonB-dependent receptor n=1 Tax=Roseateles violae TaxID=3058042 RepID=A0ABT8DZ73_9BURK|nr:TonB-dependent receptor [Pelomonas sp. PFR6]MDN3922897.1 TonB-dependent receptor [Pelomonas sp. PFR6]